MPPNRALIIRLNLVSSAGAGGRGGAGFRGLLCRLGGGSSKLSFLLNIPASPKKLETEEAIPK